jgi:acetyl-CoA/propionyl-CoA carboxylase biotin carboxyl carrier protein
VAVTYEVELGGRKAVISIRPHPEGGYQVSVDGGPERRVHAGQLGEAEWWLEDDGRRTVALHVHGGNVSVQVQGHGLLGTVVDPRKKALTQGSGATEGTIRTPMPGAVARVLVAAGDTVSAGQVLVVVEAMKMENEFRSPIPGKVVEVAVVAGVTVEAGAVLAVVEP